MYRKQVRGRRAILVLLVVACLMLISISISEAESGPLKSVQNGISSVLSPVQEGADRALKPFRDMVVVRRDHDARGENDELRSRRRPPAENLDCRRRRGGGLPEDARKLVARSGPTATSA